MNEKIISNLFELQDDEFKRFHCRLIPGVPETAVIGVRMPKLRLLAKNVIKSEMSDSFLSVLPHSYYEENNLHALIISLINDYDLCVRELNRFLPYVDNWATCDSIRPKVFIKNKKYLIGDIKKWIASSHPFTVRFGIEMLMVHFLDKDFSPDYLKMVSEINSDEYYVNMMIAWFFTTALTKQWDATIPYIVEYKLNVFCHNKAIQKSIESFRILENKKRILGLYRR